jgi:hypothetical protein
MVKPLGKWERKAGKSHITLIVEENRLHVTFIGDNPCTLHADYAATKDGVIYGVVTSIECDDEEAIKAMFDAPFSCRYRIDEGALIVRDLKCHETDSKDSAWTGSFKAVNPMPTHTAVVPPPPSAVGVGMSQQCGQQYDNRLQLTSFSVEISPVSDRNFIEQYYKRLWPEALRPNNSTNEQDVSKWGFYSGYTP